MVPYSNFMTMERVYGPSQITRYNLFTSAMITGEQAPGVSSGEALEAVEEIAAEVLPRGYDIEWSGVAREEKRIRWTILGYFRDLSGLCLSSSGGPV